MRFITLQRRLSLTQYSYTAASILTKIGVDCKMGMGYFWLLAATISADRIESQPPLESRLKYFSRKSQSAASRLDTIVTSK